MPGSRSEETEYMEEQGRLWAEIHNLRRAVEEFPKLLAAELARMRDKREEKDEAHEERLRSVELDVAKLPSADSMKALAEKVDVQGQKLEGLAAKVMVVGALFIAGIEAVVHLFIH